MAELGYSEEYQTYLDSLTKETLLKILENAYTEVFVTDADDRYVYTNPACMRHYGLTPEQMKNMNLQSELRPERWKISLSGRVKKSKKVIIAENKYYAMEQNVVTISVPILDEEGNVEMIVSTTQDPINSYDFSIKNEVKTIVSEEEDSGEIIGSSKEIKRCLSILQKVSKTDINVLILGESGTGKSFCQNMFIPTVCAGTSPLSRSTAQRFRRHCWNLSCSVMCPMPLPVRAIRGRKV